MTRVSPSLDKPELTTKVSSAFYVAKTQDLEIQALVKNAAQCLAPVWPLETFIACNPLQGFETHPFAKALELSGRACTARRMYM